MTNIDFTERFGKISELLTATNDVVMNTNALRGSQSLLPVDEILAATAEMLRLAAFALSDFHSIESRKNPEIIFSDLRQDVLGNPQQYTIPTNLDTNQKSPDPLFAGHLRRISKSVTVWLTMNTSKVHEIDDLERYIASVKDRIDRKQQNLLNEEEFLRGIVADQVVYNAGLLSDLREYKDYTRELKANIRKERRRMIKSELTLKDLKKQNNNLQRGLVKQFSARNRLKRKKSFS